MRSRKSLTALVAGALLLTLSFANVGNAQVRTRGAGVAGVIDAGTAITVRTNETINASDSDGRVFTGVVEQDVLDRQNRVAIPRGSDVELVVKEVSDNEVALDLDSLVVNGQRFALQTETGSAINNERKEGIGVNKRTGKYVGGGALLGAIIGGIAGGGKGAAIGAGAGAAAGAGAQILTRGSRVRVPAESLLTFRLAQAMRAPVIDSGYMYNGVHYHSGYNNPYEQQNNSAVQREKPGYYSNGRGDINIGSDKFITWEGPQNSTVYVQVDNEAPKLFAAGTSGTQEAPWITDGHIYTFMLRDARGNEVARDQRDMRFPARRNRYRR